ncbi:Peroxiredoxin-5, mitochondrial [Daphnia magna]|uniref:Peroxiredoxin-5 n=2 Tax=Daphnia magna TaxID=35525 RepID=A0A0P5ZXL6_9CRUS|nr:Peroxiredoxin-5, mitochondrial [Daphnia magna]
MNPLEAELRTIVSYRLICVTLRNKEIYHRSLVMAVNPTSKILSKVVNSRVGLNFLANGRKYIHVTSAVTMPVKSGDKLPSVDLYENSPASKVNIAELTAGKKVIIFGVPGAFTPGCSKTHLPGYVSDFDKFKSKGVDEIVCVSVNDPFVMAAWGKEHSADGKVRMLADTNGAFTKAMDLEKDLTGPLGSIRCQRFSMLVEDGVVKTANVEPDGTGLTCSLSNSLLSQL